MTNSWSTNQASPAAPWAWATRSMIAGCAALVLAALAALTLATFLLVLATSSRSSGWDGIEVVIAVGLGLPALTCVVVDTLLIRETRRGEIELRGGDPRRIRRAGWIAGTSVGVGAWVLGPTILGMNTMEFDEPQSLALAVFSCALVASAVLIVVSSIVVLVKTQPRHGNGYGVR